MPTGHFGERLPSDSIPLSTQCERGLLGGSPSMSRLKGSSYWLVLLPMKSRVPSGSQSHPTPGLGLSRGIHGPAQPPSGDGRVSDHAPEVSRAIGEKATHGGSVP